MVNLQKLGQAMDAATSAGANRLEGATCGLEHDLQYRKRAVQLALEDEKEFDRALAETLSQQLVSVRSVSQSAVNVPRPL